MRRILYTWLLSAILTTLAPCQSIRRITGKVLLPDGKPAQGAIVKLQNQVGEIRTAISTAGGSFQFSSLLPDVDYQVRARFGGMESNGVRWTRWSSRKQRDVTLRLRVRRSAKSSRSDQFGIGSSAPSPKFALSVRESDLDTQGRCNINRLRNHGELTVPRRSVWDVPSFLTKVA